jgi:hypothetical protein
MLTSTGLTACLSLHLGVQLERLAPFGRDSNIAQSQENPARSQVIRCKSSVTASELLEAASSCGSPTTVQVG